MQTTHNKYEMIMPNLLVHKKCQYIMYYYFGICNSLDHLCAKYGMTVDGYKIDVTKPMHCEACGVDVFYSTDVEFVIVNDKFPRYICESDFTTPMHAYKELVGVIPETLLQPILHGYLKPTLGT